MIANQTLGPPSENGRPSKSGRTSARLARADLTASTATTASNPPLASTNQPRKDDAASGGETPRVADEPQPSDQPPLDIKLNGDRFPQRSAEGGRGAVYGLNLAVSPPGPRDRIDLCAQCGPTEWQWTGTTWICRECGAPARKSVCRSQSVAARVNSTGTGDQPNLTSGGD
jgi:hypothetical protein